MNFLSHCSRKRKINLIKTLCHRTVTICSSSMLEDELKEITTILEGNGYPSDLICKKIGYHREKMTQTKKLGAERCRIAIKLPYIGGASTKLERELKMVTERCYFAVSPRVVFTSRPIVSHVFKDRIPMKDKSMVVYHFKCCCNSSYVGQTVRRLGVRMREHIPACVVKHYKKNPNTDYKTNSTLVNAAKKSSIAEHLLINKNCGMAIDTTKFSILKKCNTNFELYVYEAVLIAALEPPLCKQKEFDFVTSFI